METQHLLPYKKKTNKKPSISNNNSHTPASNLCCFVVSLIVSRLFKLTTTRSKQAHHHQCNTKWRVEKSWDKNCRQISKLLKKLISFEKNLFSDNDSVNLSEILATAQFWKQSINKPNSPITKRRGSTTGAACTWIGWRGPCAPPFFGAPLCHFWLPYAGPATRPQCSGDSCNCLFAFLRFGTFVVRKVRTYRFSRCPGNYKSSGWRYWKFIRMMFWYDGWMSWLGMTGGSVNVNIRLLA